MPPLLGRLRRRVNLLPLTLGLLTIVVSVAGISGLLAQRGAVTTIWVAAREIDPDAPLTADSLSTAEVTGTVRFEHYDVVRVPREQLLAAVPRVAIPAGTPLAAGQFRQGDDRTGPPGRVVTVAIAVGPTHLPADLHRGDNVLLVGVPGSASRPDGTAGAWPGSAPIEQEATVVGIDSRDQRADVTVTVSVPRSVADDVAWLAGQGRVVIARGR